MPYTVSLSDDKNHIVCRVTGELTVELARDFRAAYKQLSEATGITLFLIDSRGAPNRSDTFENYSYAYDDMKKMSMPMYSRAAMLVDPGDHSHDFVETVMRNAGYNSRLFRNEARAIAWLMGDVD